jgi:hypothetical protein
VRGGGRSGPGEKSLRKGERRDGGEKIERMKEERKGGEKARKGDSRPTMVTTGQSSLMLDEILEFIPNTNFFVNAQ